jgi:GNAT superfamily N-acetyltransferase
MTGQLTYIRLTEPTTTAVDHINNLIKQMSRTPKLMDEAHLRRVLANPGSFLVAMDGDRIVGCGQLCVEVLPSKVKGWLEDVVVDSEYRGQGIAGKIIEMAVSEARNQGCKHINLTSGADRESAHGLYERMGFKQRTSVQFRLNLT